MLDSLLTVNPGAVGWLLGFCLICVGLDRGIALITKLPLTMFALFAAAILGYTLVAVVYTLGKRVLNAGSRKRA